MYWMSSCRKILRTIKCLEYAKKYLPVVKYLLWVIQAIYRILNLSTGRHPVLQPRILQFPMHTKPHERTCLIRFTEARNVEVSAGRTADCL